MRTADYIIVALVIVWFGVAVRSIIKNRGGCSCAGAQEGCSACGGNRQDNVNGAVKCTACKAHAGDGDGCNVCPMCNGSEK